MVTEKAGQSVSQSASKWAIAEWEFSSTVFGSMECMTTAAAAAAAAARAGVPSLSPPVCLPACLPACPSAQDPFSLSSPPLASLLIVLLSASRTKPADSALECELEEEDFWRLKDRREGGRDKNEVERTC